MSNFKRLVAGIIGSFSSVEYSTASDDRRTGVADFGRPGSNMHYDLEWRGESWLMASHMNDYLTGLTNWVAELTHELALASASEAEWEATADKVLSQVARDVMRAMFETPNSYDPMRLASWVAKREAMKKIGSAVRVTDNYYGLDREDVDAVLASRRQREEAEAERIRNTVTELHVYKQGGRYRYSLRNRHGVELHEVETELTRFPDAKADAAKMAEASSLRVTY